MTAFQDESYWRQEGVGRGAAEGVQAAVHQASHPPPYSGGAPLSPPRDGPERQSRCPQTQVPQALIDTSFRAACAVFHYPSQSFHCGIWDGYIEGESMPREIRHHRNPWPWVDTENKHFMSELEIGDHQMFHKEWKGRRGERVALMLKSRKSSTNNFLNKQWIGISLGGRTFI